MASTNEAAHKERRRVLLLFGFSILPPLVLLTVLAAIAARTDEAALHYVEQERARQGGRKARQALHHAIREAEGAIFREVEARKIRWTESSESVERHLNAIRSAHPIATRFFVLDSQGSSLWPSPDLPFLTAAAVEGAPAQVIGTPESGFRRRAELQALYERSAKEQRSGNLRSAVLGFRTVAMGSEATPTLACRAAYRLGCCLEAMGRYQDARLAFERAVKAPFPIRDELGTPLRVASRLARVRLAKEVDGANASREGHALGHDLLAGVYRQDVRESEWRETLAAVHPFLEPAKLQAQKVSELRLNERLAWLETIGREAPTLLTEAREAAPGDVRPYKRLTRPPLVLAYKVTSANQSGDSERFLVVGLQLNLDALASEVIAPACGSFSLEEEVSVSVQDGEGTVRAYAAGNGGEKASAADPSATLALGPVPWTVRVTRSAVAMAAARRNQLFLYGGLILLTIVSAVAGAITTMRYVQRSLELAKMKSDFLSNMTHELKTPLTSIKMYGEMIAAGRLRTEEKRKEYAEHIVREGDRLHKLIENVLDFARQDEGLHEYVLAEADVADVVSEALDLFRLSAKVRGFDLFVELPPVGQLPPVDLDRDAIVRSVLNLLSNAVKYSTDEKQIRVTVKRESREQVQIRVEDRGIGIDPEDLELIFDRFFRAGDELTRGVSGAGLGLALVDTIVKAHMGTIDVESEKGRGTTFTILLPFVTDYLDQWPPPDPNALAPDEVTDEAFRQTTESVDESREESAEQPASTHTAPSDVGE